MERGINNYTPHDHYWIVAGDERRVYSSARYKFVPVKDNTFVEWDAGIGNHVTRIVSEPELVEVLVNSGVVLGAELKPPVPDTVSAAQLKIAISAAKQTKKIEAALNKLSKAGDGNPMVLWNASVDFHRGGLWASAMVAGGILKEDQMDDLFIAASRIVS